MDIGTAKPTRDQLSSIPHLMIDLVEPDVEYTVACFQAESRQALELVQGPVLVVGGSGLHFRAVVDPLEFPPGDPVIRAAVEATDTESLVEEIEAADSEAGTLVDLSNRRRVVRAVEILRITGQTPTARASTPAAHAVRSFRSIYPLTVFGVDPVPGRHQRIVERVAQMREAGFLEEVAALAPRMGRLASQAVGYRELLAVLEGVTSEDDAFEATVASTVRLAKRQRTFFRADPRIRWMPAEHHESAVSTVVSALRGGQQ
jgi:tRNA dimethylallyltransferase